MRPLRRRDQALIVQLADGSLTRAAREEANARLRAIPDGDRLIERQRRVARALAAGAELPSRHPVPTPAPVWQRAPRLAVASALVAVLALLLVLTPPDGGSTVEQAAATSQLPATQPAPGATGALLDAEVDGVRFPEWGREFGWHETGMRRDEIDGRSTTTVFYEHMGHRLAYTIVSGPALPPPANARVVRRDGLKMAVYRDSRHGGHDVAVFERGGRTCVVAGHVLEVSTLIKLAAWRGGGSVRS
jgi:hypothetical protein